MLKPGEMEGGIDNTPEKSNDDQAYPSASYESPYNIVVRNPDEELENAHQELCDTEDLNRLGIYRKALKNA